MHEPRHGGAARERLAPIIRLRSVRTVVVSEDAAFGERALAALSGLGRVACVVTSPARVGDVESLLREESADVVVLDATGCEPAARRTVERLAEVAPRVGVVVVALHCTPAARELGALPKWGWTQDLRAAVERAGRDGNPLRHATLSALRRAGGRPAIAGSTLRR